VLNRKSECRFVAVMQNLKLMRVGMHSQIHFSQRPRERGVTILLVAVAIVVVLAMAALAIDVVTLYVARTEAQRAADAAALAGAKAFVTVGFTSSLPGFSSTDVCGTGSSGAANQQAVAAATQNLISGVPATVQAITSSVSGSCSHRRACMLLSV
jgi:uncharacterized membrane protein